VKSAKARKIFVSFTDAKYEPSLRRITRQAAAMGVYDEVWPYRERDLDPEFVSRHHNLLRPDVRGFGYFIWKPQVVYDALGRCNDGDVVHYCDAGCHLRSAGRSRLLEYFSLADAATSGILAFQFDPLRLPFRHDGRPLPHFRNIDWCKTDLFERFGLLQDQEFLEDFTFAATTFFVRKSAATMAIIREWRDFMDENVPLIDDSPSRLPNPPRFKEHRHDQSVFNCLARKYGFESVSAYEFDYPSLEGEPRPCSMLTAYPIYASRDKNLSVRYRVVRKIRKWWNTLISRSGRPTN
jgi:hypothetical protein